MPTSGRFEASELSRGDIRAELIAFDDVTVGYAGEAILQGLSFNVRRGEVAGLVALDGRGKSTLVRCAAGLLAPEKGKVLYETHDVYRMTFAEDQRFRARTSVVFEGGALFANRSIEQNLSLPLRYHLGGQEGDAAEFVRRLLERVGYVEPLTAFPWQVSARGRRLAAFARALVREPELVIVDRFFEALEPQDSKRLMELVLELNVKNGTSFLIVGELEPLIFQVAERVVVLEGGKLVAHGFKRQLYKNPKIKNAFETGELVLPVERHAPLQEFEDVPVPPRPTVRRAPLAEAVPVTPAPALPTDSEGFDPHASDSGIVIVTPDPDVPSADETSDSDDGKTVTLDIEAKIRKLENPDNEDDKHKEKP